MEVAVFDCVDFVGDCRRSFRNRGKAKQAKVPSLTGYSRTLPAAYCGVAVLHGANECFDDDLLRTPMTTLPAYSDDGRLTQRGDAMSQQLLPNASTSSSSASSTSASTWRPPTSTAEPLSSTELATTTTGRREGSVPPATWLPCRPLPALPRTLDGGSGLGLVDDLTAVPRIDSDRLRHLDTLGTGHFGQVERLSLILAL